ncbi:hypothetical protein [Chamaesiphon sp.]|uniref:hypothetical protein n=1 Tax=Chamaesiphon sp. TaxID=2814140 RepID=UPI0035942D51
MAELGLVVIDNTAPDPAAELKIKRDAAFAKLEARKEKANAAGFSQQKRKNQARKAQDGAIAATAVRKYTAFSYVTKLKGARLVYMTPKTATQCGIELMDKPFAILTTNGRLLGAKQISDMKCKKIYVSYGRQFQDRRTATAGKKTGRTGRSRALTKALVQKFITVNVPLDASNLDILGWIATWKKTPQLVKIGQQLFPLRDKAAIAAR